MEIGFVVVDLERVILSVYVLFLLMLWGNLNRWKTSWVNYFHCDN